MKRSVATLAFTGSVKAGSDDYRVHAGGQRFRLRRDQGFRTYDPQVGGDFPPSLFCVVIKFYLMRSLGQRDRSFAHEGVPLRPIVEHQLLVDIEAIAAILAGTLHECEIRSGNGGGKETGPAN